MPNPSRFSEEQIAVMAARYQNGETMAAIGADYGVHRGTVDSFFRCRDVPILSPSQAKRKYPFREDAFDVIADESTAYWLGFLCADGCVVLRRGSGEVHLVLQKKDIPHLERYRVFMQTQAPIRKEARYETYRVSLYSFRLAAALNDLGCTPRKSLSLQLPALTDMLLPHFVRGYFDGDGSAYWGKGAPYLTLVGNRAFVSNMQDAIQRETHIQGRLYPHIKSPVWYLVFCGRLKVATVRTWLYADASVWLPRKRHRLAAMVPEIIESQDTHHAK